MIVNTIYVFDKYDKIRISTRQSFLVKPSSVTLHQTHAILPIEFKLHANARPQWAKVQVGGTEVPMINNLYNNCIRYFYN